MVYSPEGLLWARPCKRPAFIPVPRLKGAKAAGIRFEKRFAEYLKPGAVNGQWFEYEDVSGLRYCQPDVLLSFLPRYVVVAEVKYTLVPEAFDQLTLLYKPIVEASYNCRAGLVAVFKNFPDTDKLYLHETIEDAAEYSLESGLVGLVHWMGQPVLRPPNPRIPKIRGMVRDSGVGGGVGTVPKEGRDG